jgi:predicted nucleic acid-binding protein
MRRTLPLSIVFDTSVVIYFLNTRSEWHKMTVEMFELVETCRIEKYISEMTVLELLSDPSLSQEKAIELNDDIELMFGESILLSDVLLEAAGLRRIHHLKAPDAVQLASCSALGHDWFVTNDKDLLRIGELKSQQTSGSKSAIVSISDAIGMLA